MLVSIPFIAGQWSLLISHLESSGYRINVSIPFIAGQWSLQPRRTGPALRSFVSIPFIAGQWSLHDHADVAWSSLNEFQSPSLRGSGRFAAASAAVAAVAAFQSPSLRGSGRFKRFMVTPRRW